MSSGDKGSENIRRGLEAMEQCFREVDANPKSWPAELQWMALALRELTQLPPVLAPIPAEFEQLGKFYQVTDMEALVRAQEGHIQSLQAKLPPIRDTEPRRVREG